jgi:hypothetical protein
MLASAPEQELPPKTQIANAKNSPAARRSTIRQFMFATRSVDYCNDSMEGRRATGLSAAPTRCRRLFLFADDGI